MKSFTLIFIFAVCAGHVAAQSKTFSTLRNKFSGHENVFHFKVSGFFARTAMKIAGEHEFGKAIVEMRSARFISIPKEAFDKENVSVKGLKKLVLTDSFQQLASISGHGDEVTLYLREGRNKKHNQYLVLVNSIDHVLAVEIKGFIDPETMRANSDITAKQ